jgi:hypothetical protein
LRYPYRKSAEALTFEIFVFCKVVHVHYDVLPAYQAPLLKKQKSQNPSIFTLQSHFILTFEILFFCHLGPQEDGWTHDPFFLVRDGDVLHGRVGGKADLCAWLRYA